MGGGGGETSVCSRDYFRSTRDWGNSYTPLSTREGRGANELDRTDDFSFFRLWVMFLVLFYSFFVSFVSLNFFFSSSDAVILLVCRNALRKVRVSKKRTIDAVRSPVSHTIFFGISMKSQFYHSSRFTSPSSVLLFFFVFSYLYGFV